MLKHIPTEILHITGKIKHISYPKEQGCTSEVAFLHAENKTFVLKQSTNKLYQSWLKKEANVLNALSRTNLPTPQPHHFLEKDAESWLLMEKLPGIPLTTVLKEEKDEQRRAKLMIQFGAMLAKVHSTPTPAALRTATHPWLESTLEEAQHNLEHYDVDGSQELLNRLKTELPTPVDQTLIHGDFTVDNVLVDDGRITGIIDWSGGADGDPRYDAALAVRPKSTIFQWPQDWHTFFEGYGHQIIDKQQYDYFANGIYEFF